MPKVLNRIVWQQKTLDFSLEKWQKYPTEAGFKYMPKHIFVAMHLDTGAFYF